MMYETVVRIIAENQESWATIPAFEEAYVRLTAALSTLKESVESHDEVILGAAKAKEKLKVRVIAQALRFVGLLKVHAEREDDVILASKVDLTLSDFKRAADRNRLSKLKNLSILVEVYQTELVAYGLETNEVTEFIAKVAEYENVLVDPREAIVNRGSITEAIEAETRIIDTLLRKEFDPFMLALQSDHPVFAGLYVSARTIIDHRGKRGISNAPPEVDDGGF